MAIPASFGQATMLFTGTCVPTGAAVTFGFSNDGATTAENCAAGVRTAWIASAIMARLSNSLVLSQVRVKLGPDATGPMAEVEGSALGGTAGDSPPNIAALFTKSTAFGGRQGRGRFFLPGITEGDILNGGNLLAAAVTAFGTAANNLLTELDNANVPMVLLHGDPANTPDLVTSMSVSTTLATQRRRLRR